MDTNRIHSSASADAGQAASEASAHATQMQPATLQFADATPPRDLVSGLANLRTHAAARAAADERQGAGASGSFDELEAKHVKTERQSQLGRTWETFQRTVLGNDTRVHRGPMTPDVLAELTRRMRPQP